jgi:hypothetical protein
MSRDAAKKTPIRLRLSGAALQERNDRMPDTHVMSSVRSRVSPEEWQARLDCAAVYRLMAHFGQTDLIFNHITLRVPGDGLDRRDPSWRD